MNRPESPGPPRQPRVPQHSRVPQKRRVVQRPIVQRPVVQRPVIQPSGAPQMTGSAGPRPRQARPVSGRLAQALAGARAWARPASTGVRLAAFAIDTVAVIVVAAVVWFAAASPLLGILAGLEAAVVLAFLEARTGLTLGNAAMRIRTVRDDAPYSPGVARGFVRALVLGAGSLFALIGGFAIVATSAADPMRMSRSWADRAARTLVVRVPSRAERAAWSEGAEAWATSSLVAPDARDEAPFAARREAHAPSVTAPHAHRGTPVAAQGAPATVAPAVAPAAAPAATPAATPGFAEHGVPHLRPTPITPATHAGSNTGPVQGNQALPSGVVPVEAPIAAPPPVRQVIKGEQLLLTFDTGQRLQLPLPTTINLGRKPDPTESEDQLCIVEDPDSSVSKTHIRLECRGESVWLTDLGSTNGSALIDETGESSQLTAGSRVRLEDGSRVKIGNRVFTVATVVGEMQM